MRTELNGIPVFVAVVECGNFAQAAQQLHVTRSAIGKTIARLEERLGVTLFMRTTRNQSLTEEGEILYQRACLALNSLREAEDEIQRGKTLIKGRLRISLPVLFGQRCIAPLLFTLFQDYPQLKPELSFTDRQVNLPEEGIDMAVRIGAFADTASLEARRLATHRMILCASADYLRQHGIPNNLTELKAHPAIGYHAGGQTQRWHLSDEGKAEVAFYPNAVLLMNDYAAIAAAVSHGLGIAWLPDWLISGEIARGQLVQILAHQTSTAFDICAVWPQAAWVPHRVRVVVERLVAALPDQIARAMPVAGLAKN